ncbi:MAG: PadR family transcriptional regulator [Solirubrobacteraceae bacterium]
MQRVGAGQSAIKPMSSPVYWALLGLLVRRADYGYRLRQRFETSYAGALEVNSESHVYTALNELQRRGLIEEAGAATPGSRRQPRVRYRATAEGVEAYLHWMLAQADQARRQAQLFSRALTMLEGAPALALEILEHYEANTLRQIGQPSRTAPQPSGSALSERLVGESERQSLEGRLPWIEFARGEFEKLLHDEP